MLLTEEQMRDQIREYWKVSVQHERLGQWLMNRMPLKVNDPDLFYEKNDNIAVSKYQQRYVVASEEETKAWIEAKKSEGIPQVNIQEVKDLIQKIEFNTSGSDGSCYTTVCTLTTNFGFKAIDKSGAIHEEGFNEGVSKRFAFQNAFSKLVEHHSYLVRYNLDKAGQTLVRSKSTKPKYVQEDDGA